MKKKLICGLTGSTGSLGKELIKKNRNIKFSLFQGDIRNKKSVIRWINNNQLDLVIHLAAIVPIRVVNSNKKKAYQVNYIGTKNVIDATAKAKIKWFFFASTSHVYFSSKNKINEKSKIKPISYYGYTKLKAEKYIQKKLSKTKTKYCIGRIFSTANIKQKKNYLVPDLVHKIKKSKKTLVLKNLNHYRDFISMKTISKIIFVLHRKNFNGIVNIASGKKTLLKDIAKQILKKYSKKGSFYDNKKQTALIANIRKLKKHYKSNLKTEIAKMIS